MRNFVLISILVMATACGKTVSRDYSTADVPSQQRNDQNGISTVDFAAPQWVTEKKCWKTWLAAGGDKDRSQSQRQSRHPVEGNYHLKALNYLITLNNQYLDAHLACAFTHVDVSERQASGTEEFNAGGSWYFLRPVVRPLRLTIGPKGTTASSGMFELFLLDSQLGIRRDVRTILDVNGGWVHGGPNITQPIFENVNLVELNARSFATFTTIVVQDTPTPDKRRSTYEVRAMTVYEAD